MQKELAEVIGVTSQAISNYERGREPSYDILIKLAEYFNVSTDYLTGKNEYRTMSELIDEAALKASLSYIDSNLLDEFINSSPGDQDSKNKLKGQAYEYLTTLSYIIFDKQYRYLELIVQTVNSFKYLQSTLIDALIDKEKYLQLNSDSNIEVLEKKDIKKELNIGTINQIINAHNITIQHISEEITRYEKQYINSLYENDTIKKSELKKQIEEYESMEWSYD